MILESAKIPACKFTWNNTVGTAMASDLGFRAGQVPYRQIYDDACDIGLVLVGRRESKIFLCKRPMANAEGEIYGWLFESADNNFSAVIFND